MYIPCKHTPNILSSPQNATTSFNYKRSKSGYVSGFTEWFQTMIEIEPHRKKNSLNENEK